MKTKIQIFSDNIIKSFFLNFENYYDLTLIDIKKLNSEIILNKISIIFLDNKNLFEKFFLKDLFDKNDVIVICENQLIFEKFSLDQKYTLVCPIPINKIIDFTSNFINLKKQIVSNTILFNSTITNKATNETKDLTDVENYILTHLFREKHVKKEQLEREALDIKKQLNTSSLESHLNRIRKKLKLIKSKIGISTKDNNIIIDISYLER